MSIRIVKNNTPEEKEFFTQLYARRDENSKDIKSTVEVIINDVYIRGWDAVCHWSLKLDNAPPREITAAELKKATDLCDRQVLSGLEAAAKNILDYQSRLKSQGEMWNSPDGARVGYTVRGLASVGMYVPGGTAAYPSSVLMNAIPAKAAQVGCLTMVTPPTVHLKNEVLAAAAIAGVDRVFAVGGVQAVAALAFGAGEIPKADKIVGPGNAYVAEAKRMLYGKIDIDMIAGPSEVLIIADRYANPVFIAADMLSQAEHDVNAAAFLVTDSTELAKNVSEEIEKQLLILSRNVIARASIDAFGGCIICDSIDECIAKANEIAPEHLELLVEDAEELVEKIENAGAIFVGAWSPEPMGDYIAGPSHVLPTSGTARFFSPLSTEHFLKKTSVICYDKASFAKSSSAAIAIAENEGLTAHAESIRRRVNENT